MHTMLVALVGLPNKGKTTLFNALTRAQAQIADYPFTTIDPNKGVAFATVDCPCKEKAPCSPRNGACVNGKRRVPINIIDVAGLVDGAHEGKGRGNQFLSDLGPASALICVADASGSTDSDGNKCELGSHDPAEDVKVLEKEIDLWLASVVKRNAPKARGNRVDAFQQSLSGVGVTEPVLKACLAETGLSPNAWEWSKEECLQFAVCVRRKTKPIIVAANKCDLSSARSGVESLRALGYPVYELSADYELALEKASERGLVEYDGSGVTVKTEEPRLRVALDKIKGFVDSNRGTGVQRLLNRVAFETLELMVAYPVQDEKHWTDNKGAVLPDAILLPKGSTAVDLARAIHTDLVEGFLHAVDARTHMRLGREHALENGAVVKIVSTK